MTASRSPRHQRLAVAATGACVAVLLLAAGCETLEEPTIGDLEVSVATSGGDLDPNGYHVTVDGVPSQPLTLNGTGLIAGLPTGTHDVALEGVAGNCNVTGGSHRQVVVSGGETARVAFAVGCVATGFTVTTSTTGVDLDLDGYAVSVDGGIFWSIPSNGSVTITRLIAGSHTLTLTGMSANCSPLGSNPRLASVATGDTAVVAFPVVCGATSGSVEVTAASAGLDIDPDGYVVWLDSSVSRPLPANGVATFQVVSGGAHVVRLDGLTANCAVSGANPRSVSVSTGAPARDTARTTFQVDCVSNTAIAAVEVTAATSGMDLDTNGYAVRVDSGTWRPLPTNGVVTVDGLGDGDHTVLLGDVAANCAVADSNPRTLHVTTGGATKDTARTVFQLTCASATGILAVSVATSGADIDPDGYSVLVDYYCDYYYGCWYGWSEPSAVNDTVAIAGVSVGDHTVWLDGVAPNCTITGPNPRAAPVPSGDTAWVAFAVTCALTGSVQVTATATGVDLDAYFTAQVDGGPSHGVAAGGVTTIDWVPEGDHTVTLGDVAGNCTVANNPQVVHITAHDTVAAAFQATCISMFGELEVSVASSGVDIDPDGYTVLVDYVCDYYYGCYYQWTEPVAVNDTVRISNVPMGAHTVWLAGVAANCTVGGPNPRSLDLPPSDTARVAFSVTCVQTGALALSAATTGTDPDPNGYVVAVDGAAFDTTVALPANGSVTIPGLLPGDYTLMLRDAAVNCDLAGANPRTATVSGGGTAGVGFDLTCAPVTRLAYTSVADGNAEIYVVNSNGTGATRLTTNAAEDQEPAWSRDGAKIAFRSNRAGNAEIYVMNADGTSPVRLTYNPYADASPAWSPDGSKIAFVSERDGNTEIYLMDADGSNPVRLTTNGAFDIAPAWAPDGSKIAFVSGRDNANGEIYLMNPDGSGVAQLTSGSAFGASRPAWSPDGTRLAFSRITTCDYYYCKSDLFIGDMGGSINQLTQGTDDYTDPTWSSDGRWIAFSAGSCSYYYGCYAAAIQVVRVNGTDLGYLTAGPVFDPAWRW